MLFLLILLLSLGAVVADILHDRRQRRQRRIRCRKAFIVWVVVTDSLPLIIYVAGLVSRDNGLGLMIFSSWALYIWLLTVPPRVVYYFFNLFGLRRTGIAAGLAVSALFLWGGTIGRTRIHVTRTKVCSEQIPAGFDGFRIVQFSDTHVGTLVNPERELTRLVDSINSLRPDLIVFSGDLVNIRASELDERAVRILSGLRAPYGVVSVTGNHDTGGYIKDTLGGSQTKSGLLVIAIQQQMGWRVLQDTTELLTRGGDTLSLSGIAFDITMHHRRHDPQIPQESLHRAYDNTSDSLYNITVAHTPQLWDQITGYGYGNLTLAGHVHAMQLKFTLGEYAFSPAQWIYKRWSGRYDENGNTLYINDGTGYVAYPMRLGAWPEVTLITLRRCE